MKALVKVAPTTGLVLIDVDTPQIGRDDVLIRILKTAICGTDVHIWEWDDWARRTIPVPMAVGHEFVGVIDELGEGVLGLERGQLVSGEGHVVCGRCRNCRAGRRHLCPNTVSVGSTRPGAFAEYLALPASNVWPLDSTIPLEVASLFDALGNAVHTALSFNLIGEDVLITGAGPIGCMAAAVATWLARRAPRWHWTCAAKSSPRRWLASACARGSTWVWRCPATPQLCAPCWAPCAAAVAWLCWGFSRAVTRSSGSVSSSAV